MTAASYDDLLTGTSSYRFRVYDQDRPRFEKLGVSQHPKVTFLTCSDSRIDPCALTDTKAGDLFVIRNAGNIVPEANGAHSGEIASLEFAVQALKTEHIVICGHSDCGAMKGLMAPEKCAHLSHVSAWVSQAGGALVALEGAGDDPQQRLNQVIAANVQLQLENLRRLDFVREGEEAGRLQLHGWVYDIGAGAVEVVAGTKQPELAAETAFA